MLLGSQCCTALQYIAEEKILSGYKLDPLLVVGLEGCWGILYFVILLPIFQHIECDGPLCHGGFIEDSMKAFDNLRQFPVLMGTSLGIILSIAGFNASGVAVTKYASSAQRSTIGTCRTMVIWIFSLIIGWEYFYWQQVIGFLLLIGGTLVYNEIVILPCKVFNKNTKARLNQISGN